MKDYSPLFSQGLLALSEYPGHHRVLNLKPRPSSLSAPAPGCSFLSFQISVSTKDGPSKPSSSKSPAPSQTAKTTLPPTPTSPSRRLQTLPKAKPAPLSSLPAIPIVASKAGPSSSPSSAAPSSVLSSKRSERKHISLVPSVRSASTSVSTQYRRLRRYDALLALEGRRRTDPTGSSFVPSILQEEDEDEGRSHLSFTSWYTAHTSHSRPRSRHQRLHHREVVDSLMTIPSITQVRGTPTTAGSFPVSYLSSTLDMFEPDSPLFGTPRRASAGDATDPAGWAANFIDLVDDDGSSSWRWSHVA